MKKMVSLGLIVAACGLVGCGQYVKYDGETDPIKNGTTNNGSTTVMKTNTNNGSTTVMSSSTGGETTSTNSNVSGVTTLNHAVFGELVKDFTSTSQDGEYVFVDYKRLSGDQEAQGKLDRYLQELSDVDPVNLESAQEQQAYWYNAYNASVIRGVLNNFGGDTKGFTVLDSGTFFSDRIYSFGGQKVALDQIENGVLRGDFESEKVTNNTSAPELDKIKAWYNGVWGGGKLDSRFHAALNCGALGCPNLLVSDPYVYRADKLEEQVTAVTKAWLANSEKGAGPNGVSMLFTWYKGDFELDKGSVDAFITEFREGGVTGVDTSQNLDYDWTLNAP